MDYEEKVELDKEVESKQKDNPSMRKPWQDIPMYVWAIGALLLFFIMKNINQSENKNTYYWLIIIIIAMYIIFSKQGDMKLNFVTPKEAELLVERECVRKINWGQFPLGTQYRLLPVVNSQHRDARGNFYILGVNFFESNNNLNENYMAKVQMSGPERGYVSFVKNVGQVNGNEAPDEKTIMSELIKAARRDPVLERMIGRLGR
jgi:hypothetical protein